MKSKISVAKPIAICILLVSTGLSVSLTTPKEPETIANNYEAISKAAQKNKNINDWIKKITHKSIHSYQEDLKDLYKLPISKTLKKFMESNLKDKYDTFNSKQRMSKYETTHTTLANYKNKYIVNGAGEKILSITDNKPIPINGTDEQTINDYTFAEDVSYIRWSNQTVYNNMAKTIDPKIIAEMKSNADAISRFFTQDKKEIVLGAASMSLGILSFGVSEVLKASLKIAGSLGVASKISGSIAMGEIPTLVAGAVANNENFSKDATKTSIDIGVSLGAIAVAAAGNPVLGLVLGLVWSALHILGPGNGASFIENWNDHGLNDWRYQMKHNFINMAKTAHNFSNNYKEGVMWKITDGWFTFPEIWVGSQKSGTPWKFISPGISFNFGNKLGVWKP